MARKIHPAPLLGLLDLGGLLAAEDEDRLRLLPLVLPSGPVAGPLALPRAR